MATDRQTADRLERLEAEVFGDGADTDDGPPDAEQLVADNTRPELDDLAREAGVENPEDLDTKADVANAIVDAR